MSSGTDNVVEGCRVIHILGVSCRIRFSFRELHVAFSQCLLMVVIRCHTCPSCTMTMSCMMRQGVSMYTSLDRFRIKPGKEDLAREWFRYLNDHLAEANATMPAEGAHIESWFLHEESDGLYGYVYVIYDDNDKAVEVCKESENPLDIKHNEYMNACIDYHDYAEMKPAVALGDYSVFRR